VSSFLTALGSVSPDLNASVNATWYAFSDIDMLMHLTLSSSGVNLSGGNSTPTFSSSAEVSAATA
jgi:hypothetical protein